MNQKCQRSQNTLQISGTGFSEMLKSKILNKNVFVLLKNTIVVHAIKVYNTRNNQLNYIILIKWH